MATFPSRLRATNAEFVPRPMLKAAEVVDATIVTCHPPDIARTDFVVGICAVPSQRAANDDLGHHIAAYLAWMALLTERGIGKYKQMWLSQTDLATAQNDNLNYAGRGLSGVAGNKALPTLIEPNAQALVDKFMSELAKKIEATHENDDTLIIIACGLTSLEQDIFILDGEDYNATITSESIRALVGNDAKIIFITPSVTSVGWQVNPSFTKLIATKAQPIEFASRQCGAVFGSKIIHTFYDDLSPFLTDHVSGRQVTAVPVVKSHNLQTAEGDLHETLYARLAGRHGLNPTDQTFRFDEQNDPWNHLIGSRRGISLTKFSERWGRLNKIDIPVTNVQRGFRFLGSAFGGARKSQLVHLKHMYMQSHNSPGYHSNNPTGLQKHFDGLLRAAEQDEAKCHILFNALEQRISLIALGDLVVKSFGLPANLNKRCRDWSERKWLEKAPASNRILANNVWGGIMRKVPPIVMPYGRNLDPHKELFKLLSTPTRYIACAVIMRCPEVSGHLQEAIDDIGEFLAQIINHQVKLLFASAAVCQMGADWAAICKVEGRAEDVRLAAHGGHNVDVPIGAPNILQFSPQTIPSLRFAPVIPRVLIQPSSLGNNTAAEATTSWTGDLTATASVQSSDRQVSDTASIDKPEATLEAAPAAENSYPDVVLNLPALASSEKAADELDGEVPLAPHVPSRLQPPCPSTPTKAVTAPTIPVGAISTADASQCERQEGAKGLRSQDHHTSPHRRVTRAPNSAITIRYR